MRPNEDVHAPLAAPTYLTHVTVPVFRRARALAVAAGLHVAAALVVLAVLHHHFRAITPQEATVALVIEPSPFVGSGPTIIAPKTRPARHALRLRAAPEKTEKKAPPPANATQTDVDRAAIHQHADLPLPAPPAPPAPRPVPLIKPTQAPAPAPHLGNNQPSGFGLVADSRIVPARPDDRVNVPPYYPPDALAHGEAGRVLLAIQVAPDGRPRTVTILRSSGFAVLDNAARDAILGWRFLPAVFQGKPVASMLLLPVSFEIDRASARIQ